MEQSFNGMSVEEAGEFASRWLPAWTGGDPEPLLAFYAEDAVYSDPAVPGGLSGHGEIRPYFRKLLAAYPDWVWTQRFAVPMEGGFLNHWHASIPAPSGPPTECDGVCTVTLDGDGLISANHVYFDRSALLAAGRSA